METCQKGLSLEIKEHLIYVKIALELDTQVSHSQTLIKLKDSHA